jgi:spermidine synthase
MKAPAVILAQLLNPEGIFCQWLPLYQLDMDTLRVIIKTYLKVFPDATAHIAN